MPSFPSLGIATKAVIAARINRNRWLTFTRRVNDAAGWLQANG
jgi:hypothetical protein